MEGYGCGLDCDAAGALGVLAGLAAGESLGLAGQVATFADKNAATAKVVTVSGTTLVDTSTGLASNYTVDNPTGLTAAWWAATA